MSIATMSSWPYITLLLPLLFLLTKSIDNGLGKTPQMGWNSWNYYQCNINETVIKENANRLIEYGLNKLGYQYVNIDDCWQAGRDHDTGFIIVDDKKFPSGIDGLAKYIHAKGLKIGIYSDAGYKTCEGNPGSYGFEKIDAQTYARWGIDYLKYDNCFAPNVSSSIERYTTMSIALNKTGRPIFYSLCNWGEEKVWQWGAKVGNSWRTTLEIKNNWSGVISNLQQQVGLEKFAGPGGWNDPDMLQIGNGGLNNDEQISHFALWCLLKAPLIIGTNLNNISKQSLEILMNKQLIDINQDSLGIQGKRVKSQVTNSTNKQVWAGPLSKDRYVVVLFNRGQSEVDISVSLKTDLKLDFVSYTQRDPIRNQDIPVSTKDVFTENVKSHCVEVRILTLKKAYLNQQ